MKEHKITDIMAQEQVIRAVKIYGIEGTEQKIKEVYTRLPKVKESMLRAWKTIYMERNIK